MNLRRVRSLLFALAIFTMAAAAYGQVGLFITVAPPPLPVYEQPLCPDDGYIWTPGFWAYDSDIEDYYWVPGTWVQPPEVGYLWTPAYWGWGGDRFVFYDGYWGPLVGFYGGVNYGFGYFGLGFEGGRWDNGRLFYNQAVSNVNVTVIHNVYNDRVEQRTENRVSYNGGEGGLSARPTPQQEAAARDRHVPPVAAQMQHRQEARSNPLQRALVNKGRPDVAATARPGGYRDHGAVHATAAGGNYNPPANRGGAQSRENAGSGGSENAGRDNGARSTTGGAPTSYNHVREMPPYDRPSSNGSTDKKYQKEQDKMYQQQQKERQKIAQQQEREDQRVSRQNNEQAKQQLEQRHQQQTQEMQSRHQQQQEQMRQKSAPQGEPRTAPGRRPPQ